MKQLQVQDVNGAKLHGVCNTVLRILYQHSNDMELVYERNRFSRNITSGPCQVNFLLLLIDGIIWRFLS